MLFYLPPNKTPTTKFPSCKSCIVEAVTDTLTTDAGAWREQYQRALGLGSTPLRVPQRELNTTGGIMTVWQIALAIVMLSVIVVVMLRFVSRRTKPRYQSDAEPLTNPYRCVSIHYRGDACEAVKKLAGQRFLSKETPQLPLPRCTAVRCSCRYAHHEDRRVGERRSGLRSPFAMPVSDRRMGRGRRWPDKFPS